MIKFTIPITPVAKGRPRLGRYGVFTPDKTRQYESELKALMRSKLTSNALLAGPLYLSVRFILLKPKRPKHKSEPIGKPDLDNFWKAIADAGNGILWLDDSQIVETYARKLFDVSGAGPRIEIEVKEL